MTPIKDVIFTVCYYNEGHSEEAYVSCKHYVKNNAVQFIALIPLMLRFIHVIKTVKGPQGNFVPRALFNVVKFAVALTIPVLSFISLKEGVSLPLLMIVLTGTSTVMMFSWDLYVDWGLLQPNSTHRFLRNDLAYSNTTFYYVAMNANLILRLTWIINMSPEIIENLGVDPELGVLLLGFLE